MKDTNLLVFILKGLHQAWFCCISPYWARDSSSRCF